MFGRKKNSSKPVFVISYRPFLVMDCIVIILVNKYFTGICSILLNMGEKQNKKENFKKNQSYHGNQDVQHPKLI